MFMGILTKILYNLTWLTVTNHSGEMIAHLFHTASSGMKLFMIDLAFYCNHPSYNYEFLRKITLNVKF